MGHLARNGGVGGKRNVYRILVRKPESNNHFEVRDLGEKIILK
jgi:hypothetical protein